jgi:hypothetical protein
MATIEYFPPFTRFLCKKWCFPGKIGDKSNKIYVDKWEKVVKRRHFYPLITYELVKNGVVKSQNFAEQRG